MTSSRPGRPDCLGSRTGPAGKLDEGIHSYTTCIDGLRHANHISDALGCYLTVAEIQLAQGRLRDALATFAQATGLAASSGDAAPRGLADIHIACARVALERGDHRIAGHEAGSGRHGLGEDRGLPPYAYRSRMVEAMLAEDEGDLPGALALVTAAQQVYLGDFSPNVRPLHAVAARLHIRLGDLDAAERWARDHDVAASQETLVPA